MICSAIYTIDVYVLIQKYDLYVLVAFVIPAVLGFLRVTVLEQKSTIQFYGKLKRKIKDCISYAT